MSQLRDRMTWQSSNYPSRREIMQFQSPDNIPTVHIQIYPGIITYEDMYPLITPDGAPIAATGKGTWGQLYAAGTQRRF